MSTESEQLKRRLIGAATVFIAAFLLAWLLPPPKDSQSTDDGHVVLQLSQPQRETGNRSPPGAPPASSTESVSSGERQTREATGQPRQAPAEATTETTARRPTASTPPAPPREERRAPPPEAADPAPSPQGNWWVQAAAYGDPEAARRGRERIRSEFSAASRLREVTVDGNRYWRLQVGPLPRESAAQGLATRLRDGGFQGARVFSEGAP